MYKVYGSAKSRAFRVLWMLEEIGAPYEHVDVGPHSEEVLARNPSGKVPVLEVEGTALTDSTAILTWLGDRHGKLTHPAGTLARARQDAALHCVLDEIDAVLWTAARHSFVLPKERRVPEIGDSLKWEFSRNLARLDRGFEGPFLMGEEMTFADIVLVHCLNWARAAGFPVEGDNLPAYGKRLRGREAFRRVAGLIPR